MNLTIEVKGRPAAQGSKIVFRGGGMKESSRYLDPWRNDVRAAADQALLNILYEDCDTTRYVMDEAVRINIVFRFARPQNHYRTGRHAHLLKDGAPHWPTSRGIGDIDKLERSTLDALTASGVWVDDSQVVQMRSTKTWADGLCDPGATIIITELTD